MVKVAELVRKCARGFMDIRWKPQMFREGRWLVGSHIASRWTSWYTPFGLSDFKPFACYFRYATQKIKINKAYIYLIHQEKNVSLCLKK